MKTILFYLVTAALISQPATSKHSFYTANAVNSSFKAPINDLHLSLRDDRIFLDWSIESNQEVDQFAIERSPNGKVFYPTGLVFSSEKTGRDNYLFFEKIRTENIAYRVLIIYKDHTAAYSPVAYIPSSISSTN